jgi:hypothetical protein
VIGTRGRLGTEGNDRRGSRAYDGRDTVASIRDTINPTLQWSPSRWRYFAARPGLAGHILWYQMDPSFTWLPFLWILSLHLGQVPIRVSFGD